jgi:hypothetical protein
VRGLSWESSRKSVGGRGPELFTVARGPRNVAIVTGPILYFFRSPLAHQQADAIRAVTEQAGRGNGDKGQFGGVAPRHGTNRWNVATVTLSSGVGLSACLQSADL